MDYLIIFALQLLGIGFHVMQKVSALGNTFPQKKRKEIFAIFMAEDWDTLLISTLVLFTSEIAHYILHHYAPSLVISYPNFDLFVFGVSFVLGYAGQSIIYKLLGTAQATIEKKISDKLQ